MRRPTETEGDAVVSEYEGLVQAFALLRERHQVDVMQPGLLACVCGERLPILYDDEGQPLYNPIIRHHHEHYASAAAKRVAEFQWDALEMARKADAAERRAEGAEAEVERLRGRVLNHLRAAVTGEDVATDECPHEWLDRPESDTRECLICGAEALG